MPAISVSAPGKIILCGEHAVVYQQPAIAIPVQQVASTTKIFAHPTAPKGQVWVKADAIQVEGVLESLNENHPIRNAVELVKKLFSIDHLPACEIRITSTIPIASGLGSSASTAVSLISVLSEFIDHSLSTAEISELAYEVEKLHHGNPSGIDNAVIAYNRPVFFRRGEPLEFLEIASPLHLIIANTGIHASTIEAVTGVRGRWQNDLTKYNALFKKIGEISEQVRQYLSSGDVSHIGQLLSLNHSYLQEMGVSCPELDALVSESLNVGALGAKLSGGGLGGNMIALVNPGESSRINNALLHAGAKSTIEMTLPANREVKK